MPTTQTCTHACAPGASAPALHRRRQVADLRRAAAAIREACPDEVRAGVFLVRAAPLKRALAAAAEAAAGALLGRLRAGARAEHDRICETFSAMAAQLTQARRMWAWARCDACLCSPSAHPPGPASGLRPVRRLANNCVYIWTDLLTSTASRQTPGLPASRACCQCRGRRRQHQAPAAIGRRRADRRRARAAASSRPEALTLTLTLWRGPGGPHGRGAASAAPAARARGAGRGRPARRRGRLPRPPGRAGPAAGGGAGRRRGRGGARGRVAAPHRGRAARRDRARARGHARAGGRRPAPARRVRGGAHALPA